MTGYSQEGDILPAQFVVDRLCRHQGDLGKESAFVTYLDPGRPSGGRVGNAAVTPVDRPGRIRRVRGSRDHLDFRSDYRNGSGLRAANTRGADSYRGSGIGRVALRTGYGDRGNDAAGNGCRCRCRTGAADSDVRYRGITGAAAGHVDPQWVRLVKLKVNGAGVAAVENPETHDIRRQLDIGESGTVDNSGIHESFRNDGRAGQGEIQRRGRRNKERTVVPAAGGGVASRVKGVLHRHVFVPFPETAASPTDPGVPERIGLLGHILRHIPGLRGGEAGARGGGGVVHVGLVLDDQGNAVVVLSAKVGQELGVRRVGARSVGAADEVFLEVVGHEVGRCQTGIDVQAGDRHRMVVVEHEPGALRVGIVISLDAVGAGRVVARSAADARHGNTVHDRTVDHVGHVHGSGTFAGGIAGGAEPRVRRSVADPRGGAAVEMDGDAVLRFRSIKIIICAVSRADKGGINRQSQLGRLGDTDAELVPYLEARGPVAVGDDRHTVKLLGVVHAVFLVIAPEGGWGKVAMHLYRGLRYAEFEVVRARVGSRVGLGCRDVLAEIVFVASPGSQRIAHGAAGKAQTGESVDEFSDVRALGKVGQVVVDKRVEPDARRIKRVITRMRVQRRRLRGHGERQNRHGCHNQHAPYM